MIFFSYCVTFFDIFEHFFHFCFVTFVYASTMFLTLQQKIMHIAIINNMHKFYENEKIAAILIVCLTCELNHYNFCCLLKISLEVGGRLSQAFGLHIFICLTTKKLIKLIFI